MEKRIKMGATKYSQLKAMLAITRGSLRSIGRSPSAIVFTLAFPMIFIVVFGGMSDRGGVVFDVGLYKNTDTTTYLYKALTHVPNFRIANNSSEDSLLGLLKRGKIDAIIGIEKDSASPGNEIVTFSTSTVTQQNGPIVKSIIKSVIYTFDSTYVKRTKAYMPAGVAAQFAPPTAEIRETPPINGREYKAIDFVLPGMLGFSLMSAGVFGTAFVFFSLRQTLVLKRFFATPIRRTYIVLGEGIARVLFQISTAVIIILFGKYIFGFTLVHGVSTALTMILLAGLGLIVFMGFGFVVSSIASNEGVIPVLANIITLPQFLLSSTFFSADSFPPWLKAISNILPLTHLNTAMRKVAFDGASFIEISPQLLIVTIWGVIIYAFAIKVFKWE